jgi:chromosomal replication initiator protein
MENTLLWKTCLNKVKEHLSPQHFSTWFSPIRLLGGATDVLTLEVPNRFFLEWVKEHYQPLIQEILRKETSKEFALSWVITEESRDEANNTASMRSKAATKPGSAQKKAPARSRRPASPSLNQKYTFENFVVGKANEFAHAACTAVSTDLASKYNPLFIYGDVGLGKTHLLQAIGQRAVLNDPSMKVVYYTSERFMNEFINYVSRQKMGDFRGKFRNVDLLLIDDIQFWGGKERTQEEFFHTFNALYESHKQIVVTSDKYPKDIAGIEERLRSRFEWGLVADIQPPDTETKLAILKSKSAIEGVELPDDVSELLVSLCGSNVRELEGYLTRIVAISSLTGLEITLSTAKEALKNLTGDRSTKRPSANVILKTVSTYYGLRPADLKSKRRNKAIALPRQVAMYLAREYGKLSYPEIGAAYKKDHSTAIHAVKKITRDSKENADLKLAIRSIKRDLGLR